MHRRAGRFVLRGLRPIAKPVLNRIQLHLRGAVAEAAAERDLLGRLERIEAHLRSDAAAMGDVSGRLERIEAHLQSDAAAMGDVSGRLERVEGHLRGETAVAGQRQEVLVAGLAEFALLLQRAQIALDALRLDQVEAARAGAERVEGLGEVAAQLRAMADEWAGLGARADAAAGQLEGRLDSLTGLVGERTEMLLRRMVIPLGEELLVRMPEGYLLLPAEDVALLAAMAESGGRLEPGSVAVIQALLREGDVMLDVGANFGLTVLPAARRVGAAGRVIAVEPASRIVGLLRRSLALNGLEGRVVVHGCAAGEAPGRAVLRMGPISGHSSLLDLPEAERTEEVAVQPLDALVPPGTRVRLAKIDVEGYEPAAWQGMQRIAAENPGLAMLVEFGPEHLRRAGITPEAWMALFTGAGFAAFEVDEVDGGLRPARPPAALAGVHSVNLLMLREPPSAFPGLRFA